MKAFGSRLHHLLVFIFGYFSHLSFPLEINFEILHPVADAGGVGPFGLGLGAQGVE